MSTHQAVQVDSPGRARIEEKPLEQAAEACARMDSGRARYRMVLGPDLPRESNATAENRPPDRREVTVVGPGPVESDG